MVKDALTPRRFRGLLRLMTLLAGGLLPAVLAGPAAAQEGRDSSTMAAVTAAAAAGNSFRSYLRTTDGSDLEIVFSPFRRPISAGREFTITTLLRNRSPRHTLYFTEKDLTLSSPAAFKQPVKYGHITLLGPHTGDSTTPRPFALRPSSEVTMTWYGNNRQSSSLFHFLNYTFFSPGEYNLAINARYWIDSTKNITTLQPADYFSCTNNVIVSASAPEGVLLLGAAIGGLIAYLIFPRRRTTNLVTAPLDWSLPLRTWTRRVTVTVGSSLPGAFGAMLWAALVTILLSRLAKTDFVVQISVPDFWGAIAAGFIAQYGGTKWLERLVPDGAEPLPPPPPADSARPAADLLPPTIPLPGMPPPAADFATPPVAIHPPAAGTPDLTPAPPAPPVPPIEVVDELDATSPPPVTPEAAPKPS